MRTLTSFDTPALMLLDCPVAPEGTVIVRGLAYRPSCGSDALLALRRARRAAVLVDGREFGEALVRDPRDGALLRAYALRADLARDLSLLAHIDGFAPPAWHGAEDRDPALADEAQAGGQKP